VQQSTLLAESLADTATTEEGTPMALSSAMPDPRRYRQVATNVRELIASGTIKPGEPAPTITELAGSHGTSRDTCAKALRLLVDEGLLTRYPGLGYFVTSARPHCPG
jgi:DNA-binding GntR family transcriptional regulator